MTPQELCETIEKILDEKKALDIVRISLKDRALMGDYFIIASGTSERQLSVIADFLREKLKRHAKVRLNGLRSSWVIADLGAVVVHLLLSETRDLYQLEDLWQAHQNNLKDALQSPEKAEHF